MRARARDARDRTAEEKRERRRTFLDRGNRNRVVVVVVFTSERRETSKARRLINHRVSLIQFVVSLRLGIRDASGGFSPFVVALQSRANFSRFKPMYIIAKLFSMINGALCSRADRGTLFGIHRRNGIANCR